MQTETRTHTTLHTTKNRRILSIILALALIISSIPLQIFATDVATSAVTSIEYADGALVNWQGTHAAGYNVMSKANTASSYAAIADGTGIGSVNSYFDNSAPAAIASSLAGATMTDKWYQIQALPSTDTPATAATASTYTNASTTYKNFIDLASAVGTATDWTSTDPLVTTAGTGSMKAVGELVYPTDASQTMTVKFFGTGLNVYGDLPDGAVTLKYSLDNGGAVTFNTGATSNINGTTTPALLTTINAGTYAAHTVTFSFEGLGFNAKHVSLGGFTVNGKTSNVVTYDTTTNDAAASAAPAAATVITGHNTTVAAAPATVSAGKKFKEWNTASAGSGTAYAPGAKITPTAAMTLYAIYDTTYTVTYDANGGTGTVPAPVVVVRGTAINVADGASITPPVGKTFGSWSTQANGLGTTVMASATYTPTANVTLYATYTAKTYAVTLTQGANGTITTDLLTLTDVQHGDTIAFTFTPDTGYVVTSATIDGTVYKNDGIALTANGTVMTKDVTITKAITVTAAYETAKTVSFNANGGTGGTTTAQKLPTGGKVTDPATVTKANYTLEGWYTDASFTPANKWNFATSTVSTDITLYAKWTGNDTMITVTDPAANGTITPATGNQAFGSVVTYTVTPAAGKIVKTVTVDGSPVTTVAGSNGAVTYDLTVGAAATIAATFADVHTVTFSNEGVNTLVKVENGTAVATLAQNPTKAGYDFVEWCTGSATGTAYNFSTPVASDFTLYAKFTPKTYAVTVTNTTTTLGDVTPAQASLNAIAHGSSVTLTFTPRGNNTVGTVTVDGVDKTATLNNGAGNVKTLALTNVTAATAVVVTFTAAPTFALTLPSGNITGGTITAAKADGATIADLAHIETGTIVRLTMTPNTGYSVTSFTQDSTAVASTDMTAGSNGAMYKDITITKATTISAVTFTLNTYAITFNVDTGTWVGGTAPTQANVSHGGSFTLPVAATVTPPTLPVGSKFKHWSDGTQTYAGGAEVTGVAKAMTFTAVYAVPHAITLPTAANGTVTATKTADVFESDTVTITFTPATNYTLKSATVDGATVTTTPTGSNNVETYSLTMPAKDVAVTAVFVTSHTVTFNSEGTTTTATVENGTVVAKPTPDPTKANYNFTFWSTNANANEAGTAYDFATLVTADITLYAKFAVKTYAVTLTQTANGVITTDQTDLAAIPHGTRVRYTFTPNSGYVVTSATIGGTTYANANLNTGTDLSTQDGVIMTKAIDVTADTAVTAAYETAKTVTFELNGGTAAQAGPQLLPTGAKVVEVRPTKTNYTFGGWYTDANFTSGSKWNFNTSTVSTDITLYAKWTGNNTMITVTDPTAGNGTITPATGNQAFGSVVTYTVTPAAGKMVKTVTVGGSVVSTTPTGSDGAVTFNHTVAGTATIAATFADVHTVTFNNGGVNTVVKVENGTAVTAPTTDPTKEGYNFTFWSTNAVESEVGTAYDFNALVSADITLYAKFAIKTYAVTLTQGANGTITTAPTDLTAIPHGTSVTFTFTPAANYVVTSATIDGTVYANDGMALSTRDGIVMTKALNVTAATVVTAAYETAKTVTFELNGGTAAQAGPQLLPTGAKVVEVRPTKTNYTFGGWYQAPNFAGSSKWDFNTNIVETEDITLYAKWTSLITVTTPNVADGKIEPPTGQQTAETSVRYIITPAVGKMVKSVTVDGTPVATTPTGLDNGVSFNHRVGLGATIAATFAVPRTVTFDNGTDTTTVPAKVVADGTAVTAPATPPTKIGHTFVEWCTDSATGTTYDFNTLVTANTTLYAKWTVNKYAVKVNDVATADGTVTTSPAITAGTTGTLVDFGSIVNFTITPAVGKAVKDVTLNGRNVNSELTDNAGSKVYALMVATVNDVNITFDTAYAVTYNTNGGTGTVTNTTVTSGTKLTQPTGITKAGHTLLGWTEDAVTAPIVYWIFETDTVIRATTLTAVWEAETYTVTFQDNTTEGTDPTPIAHVGYNQTLPNAPTPAPTKTGYRFGGWYIDDTTFVNAFVFGDDKITGNTTLYAKWTVNKYAVKVNAVVPADGTVTTSPAITADSLGTLVDFGSTVVFTITPANGKAVKAVTLNGTDVTSQLTDAVDNKVYTLTVGEANDVNITFDNTYAVTYDVNGGTGTVTNTTVISGTKLTQPTGITKVGSRLLGWTENATASPVVYWDFATGVVTKATTLTAVWEAETYTVTFQDNTTEGTDPTPIASVAYDTAITAPATAPVKANYTFDGWYKEDTLTTPWNFTTDKVTANITLYAKFTGVSKEVTLTTGAGGTVTSVPTTLTAVPFGTEVTFTITPAAGKVIDTVKLNDVVATDGLTIDPVTGVGTYKMTVGTANAVAVTFADTFTVEYNANGGRVDTAITQAPVKTGTTFTVKNSTGFSGIDTKVFKEWNTNTNGSGTAYLPDAVVTPTANLTLYAIWATPYAVTVTNAVPADGAVTSDPATLTSVLDGSVVKFTFTPAEGKIVKEVKVDDLAVTLVDGTGDVKTYDLTVTKAHTVAVTWDVKPVAPATFAVTFDLNAADAVGTIPVQNVATGGHATRPDTVPTRPGYVFFEWTTNAAGTAPFVFAATTITQATTIYAKWLKAITVTFDKGAATGTAPATMNIAEDTAFNTPAITGMTPPTGKIFKEWNTKADGTGTAYDVAAQVRVAKANVELFAIWKAKYTVTYDLNGGGIGTLPTQADLWEGATFVAAPAVVGETGNHKIFDGWNTKADGTGITYQAGDTVTPTESVTLYVKWRTVTALAGDINCDGTVDLLDALLSLKVAATVNTPPTGTLFNNGNVVDTGASQGKIDAADTSKVLETIVGN